MLQQDKPNIWNNIWSDEKVDALIAEWNQYTVSTEATPELFVELFANYFKLNSADKQDLAKEQRILALLDTTYFMNLPQAVKLKALYGVLPSVVAEDKQLTAVEYLYELKAHDVLWQVFTGELSNLEYVAVQDDKLLDEMPEQAENIVELKTVHEILMNINQANHINQNDEELTKEQLEEQYNQEARLLADKLEVSLPLTLAIEYLPNKALSQQEYGELVANNKDSLFKKVHDQILKSKVSKHEAKLITKTEQNSFVQFSQQELRMLFIVNLCDQQLKTDIGNQILAMIENEAIEYPINVYKLFVNEIRKHVDAKNLLNGNDTVFLQEVTKGNLSNHLFFIAVGKICLEMTAKERLKKIQAHSQCVGSQVVITTASATGTINTVPKQRTMIKCGIACGLYYEEMVYYIVNNQVNLIEFFIEQGFDVNTTMGQGSYTLLHHAIIKSKAAIVQLLINNGADVHAVIEEDGATPLYLAVIFNSLEIVKIIVNELIKDPEYKLDPTILEKSQNKQDILDYLTAMFLNKGVNNDNSANQNNLTMVDRVLNNRNNENNIGR